MLRILALVSVVAVVVVIPVNGQGKPDFSGRWVLVPERSVPANTWAMGKEFRVSQTAAALAVEREVIYLSSSGNQPTTSHLGAPVLYELDDSDHEHPAYAPSAPARPGSMRTYQESVTYRATWTGNKLVIMSRDVFVVERSGEAPKRSRRVIRQALSLETDGSLTAESLIVADPQPGDRPQDAPVPIRSSYRKAA